MIFMKTIMKSRFGREMIADELAEQIQGRYTNRWVQIEVSEDGENGAIMTYPTFEESYGGDDNDGYYPGDCDICGGSH